MKNKPDVVVSYKKEPYLPDEYKLRPGRLPKMYSNDIPKLRDTIAHIKPSQKTCMRTAVLRYTDDVFMMARPFARRELIISGIQLNTQRPRLVGVRPMCTRNTWDEKTAGIRCLEKMRQGKCCDPVGLVLARTLWPQKYKTGER